MNLKDLKILVLIPARHGSKGISHKNIINFYGKPLLEWSILQAQKSKYYTNMRIILTTDSLKYKEMFENKVEVLIRPENISGDLSPDIDFVKHALNKLEKDGYIPDFIVQLRPTYPSRSIKIIDNCIETFINIRHEFDSLRTVVKNDKTPFKMYMINPETNILMPLFPEYKDIHEPYNQCRQILPDTYLHNGYIDIFNYNTIINKNSISGKIYAYIMSDDEKFDIDNLETVRLSPKPII